MFYSDYLIITCIKVQICRYEENITLLCTCTLYMYVLYAMPNAIQFFHSILTVQHTILLFNNVRTNAITTTNTRENHFMYTPNHAMLRTFAFTVCRDFFLLYVFSPLQNVSKMKYLLLDCITLLKTIVFLCNLPLWTLCMTINSNQSTERIF